MKTAIVLPDTLRKALCARARQLRTNMRALILDALEEAYPGPLVKAANGIQRFQRTRTHTILCFGEARPDLRVTGPLAESGLLCEPGDLAREYSSR